MKKLVSFLILLIAFCSFKVSAQKIKVNCTVELNGTNQPDSIFIGLFSTSEDYFDAGVNPPNPVIFSRVSNNKLSFEADPGIYMIGCCAWKYAHAYRLIYLDPMAKSVDLTFIMQPLRIGYGYIDKIEKVEITGDFNKFSFQGRLQLIDKKNVWKLENIPLELKPGQKYIFIVNGQVTEDLLNDKIVADKLSLTFNGIYSGNEIIFNPLVYGKKGNDSQVEVKNPSAMNAQLMTLTADFRSFDRYVYEISKKMTDPQNIKMYVDSLYNRFDKIESKYDAGYKQLFLEKRLEIQWIRWRGLISEMSKTKPSEEQLKEFINSKMFSDFFTDNTKMLNDLDPNSFLLQGKFMQNLLLMKMITSINPDISSKFNISKSYFDEFAENFAAKSPNERVSCNLHFGLAESQRGIDENKAKELFGKHSKYQYEKYIPKERVSALYAQLNVKIGKQAPDFSITTLEGDDIKLSDFKGKFVLIDFWGSWCAPCLREIPHVKKFYSKVSREKLEIIGLAGNDNEESLKKCIIENEIKYPNALASSALLSEYGISSFPTSFLINPEGKIIRMNMRGEDELNLISEEIEGYFSKM